MCSTGTIVTQKCTSEHRIIERRRSLTVSSCRDDVSGLYKDKGANNSFYVLILTVLKNQGAEFIEFNHNDTLFSLLP